jgi:heptosyltransferase-2
MPKLKQENIKRIVVRGTNWVGDAVMTVPALRELRRLFPDAHITLATRPWAKELFANAEFLDDLFVFDRRGIGSVVSQISEWKKHRFDLAVLFQNAFEAALVPALARVPVRIGYATEGRSFLLTNPLTLPEWRSSKHEVFYYLNIIAEVERLFLGSSRSVEDYKPETSLRISTEREMAGRDLLRTQNLNSNQRVIALCPGSINSRAKRWPAERFAALADLLIESRAQILLIGSPEELDVSREVASRMKHKPVILTGKTSLSQAVDVLSAVDLLVTNDTGPAHVAAALGRPTLVIFGPTNPETTRPFSSIAEIVRHPPDCAPCMLRDCPIDHRCMTAITPEEAYERVQAMLGDKATTGTSANACPTGAVA